MGEWEVGIALPFFGNGRLYDAAVFSEDWWSRRLLLFGAFAERPVCNADARMIATAYCLPSKDAIDVAGRVKKGEFFVIFLLRGCN